MRGTMCSYKISIFYKFSKIYSIYNILLPTIFWTAPHFFTLGVAVPNTINTHEFHPKHHIWLKIQNSITIFCDYLLAFQNSCQLELFLHAVLLAQYYPNVSFKNSLTNNCCFGTSTKSPWAKMTFLYMYFF